MSYFDGFISEVEDVLQGMTISKDHYEIKHSLDKSMIEPYTDEEGTYGVMIKSNMVVKNLSSQSSLTMPLSVLHVPVKKEFYTVQGANIQRSREWDRASGWSFEKDELGNPSLTFRPERGKNLKFFLSSSTGQVMVSTNTKDPKDKKSKPLGDFLKAVTGKNYLDLIDLVGENMTFMRCLTEEKSMLTVSEEVYKYIVAGRGTTENISFAQELREKLFNKKFMYLSDNSRSILKQQISFLDRALGLELAEDIELNGKRVEKGSELNAEILKECDERLTELKVKFNGKVYDLKKYGYAENTLTAEEILTMVNMFTCYCEGLGKDTQIYSNTNRVIVTLETKCLKKIEESIDKLNITLMKRMIANPNSDLSELISSMDIIDTESIVEYLKVDPNRQGGSQINLLASASRDNKISSNAKNITEEGAAIQYNQRGRIDSIQTPESKKWDKVANQTMLSRIEGEVITVPVLKVSNGIITDEKVWLTPQEEETVYIAEWNEKFTEDLVSATNRGITQRVPKEKVDYIYISPLQDLSCSTAQNVFPGFSNPKRLMMADHQQEQAVVTVKAESPIVRSGAEGMLPYEDRGDIYTAEKILRDFYRESGESLEVSEEEFIKQPIKLLLNRIKYNNRDFVFRVDDKEITITVPFLRRSESRSLYSFRLNVNPNGIYQGDDVVLHRKDLDIRHYKYEKFIDFGHQEVTDKDFRYSYGIGENILVGVMTRSSYNIDDALAFNERMSYDRTFTNVKMDLIKHSLKYKPNIYEEVLANRYNTTNPLPDYIDENGLPKKGTYLKPGYVVYGLIKTSYTAQQVDKKKFTTKNVSNDMEGMVVSASLEKTKDGEVVNVILASIATLEQGDKTAGRYGNKGVFAKSIPSEDMPFIEETGEPLQITLNPLGVPSRMNIGQLLEINLAMYGRKNEKRVVVSPFKEGTMDYALRLSDENNLGPINVIDGETGLPLKRKVNVGVMYMFKLEHLVSNKIHSINVTSSVNVQNNQPRKGKKSNGGQSFSEYESWCLASAGAYKVLDDILTFQSSDIVTLNDIKKQIRRNPRHVSASGDNHNDKTFLTIFRPLGVEPIHDKEVGTFVMKPLTTRLTRGLAPLPLDITKGHKCLTEPEEQDTINARVLVEGKEALRENWGYLDLNTEIVNPYWVEISELGTTFIYKKVSKDKGGEVEIENNYSFGSTALLKGFLSFRKEGDEGTKYCKYMLLDGRETLLIASKQIDGDYITGLDAIIMMLKKIDFKKNLEFARELYNTCGESIKPNVEKTIKTLQRMVSDNLTGSDFVVEAFPVIPYIFRATASDDKDHDFTRLYKDIVDIISDGSDKVQLYKAIVRLLGTDTKESKDSKDVGLMKAHYAKGKEGKGAIRTSMQSKRVHFSGRTVITPISNPNMTLKQIGIPLLMACEMWGLHIRALFTNKNEFPLQSEGNVNREIDTAITCISTGNLDKFKDLKLSKDEMTKEELFYKMKQYIIEFVEEQVVIAGRQPSLHKFSVRAFRPVVTEGKSIEIHPLACSGYNADFDGDQMYVLVVITYEAQQEALEKLSTLEGTINPKDSSPVIAHSQDMLLGCYFATMLYNNVISIDMDKRYENIYPFRSVEQLEDALDTGAIEYQDLVSVNYNGNMYISTAGRVVFNSLIPDGFTEEPFENTLNIPNVNVDRYKNLKYDALMAKKTRTVDGLKYKSISEVTGEYLTKDRDTVCDVFQNIMMFGFKCCSLSGITLSIEDLRTDGKKDDLMAVTKTYMNTADDYYNLGLSSYETKRDGNLSLARNLSDTTKDLVMDFLGRNNNLFIIADSGARGNASQINQTIGIIGPTMKTLKETLDTPILGCYADGLTSQQLFHASYGTKMGVGSTQKNTGRAGYATRTLTYMDGGISVTEHDCGNTDDVIELKYEDVKGYYIGEDLTDISLEDGVMSSDSGAFGLADLLLNKKYNNGEGLVTITRADIEEWTKNKVRTLEVFDGDEKVIVKIFYKLHYLFKDLLLNRYTDDERLGVEYIDKKVIKDIERNNYESIRVRTLLSCKTKNGVCQKCYGKKFDTNKLPNIGDNVGTESAQAVGEPSAQLIISLINQGGIANQTSASGVEVLEALLRGNLPKGVAQAVLARENGVVKISELNDDAWIDLEGHPLFKVKSSALNVRDGEFVRKGDKLTKGYVNVGDYLQGEFMKLASEGNVEEAIRIIRKKQIEFLELYYGTFVSNNISIHAIHFELPVRLQTSCGVVTNAPNESDYKVGGLYPIEELLREPNLEYDYKPLTREQVIYKYSGPMALLAYENGTGNMKYLTTNIPTETGMSYLGKIMVGCNTAQEGLSKEFTHPEEVSDDDIRMTKEEVDNDGIIEFHDDVDIELDLGGISSDFGELDLDFGDEMTLELDDDDFDSEEVKPVGEGMETDIQVEDKEERDSSVSRMEAFK